MNGTSKSVKGQPLLPSAGDVHSYLGVRGAMLHGIGRAYEMIDADLSVAVYGRPGRLTYEDACDAVIDYVDDHAGLNSAVLATWHALTSMERRAMVRVAMREYFTPDERGEEGL